MVWYNSWTWHQKDRLQSLLLCFAPARAAEQLMEASERQFLHLWKSTVCSKSKLWRIKWNHIRESFRLRITLNSELNAGMRPHDRESKMVYRHAELQVCKHSRVQVVEAGEIGDVHLRTTRSLIGARTPPFAQRDCLSTHDVPGVIVGPGCPAGSNWVRSCHVRAHVLLGVGRKQKSIESFLDHLDTAGTLRKIERCLPGVKGRLFLLVGHLARLLWVTVEAWNHWAGQEFPEEAQIEWAPNTLSGSEAWWQNQSLWLKEKEPRLMIQGERQALCGTVDSVLCKDGEHQSCRMF